jgi:hypothetical protein
MDCCTEGGKTEGEESLVFVNDEMMAIKFATASRRTPGFPDVRSWYIGFGDRFQYVSLA